MARISRILVPGYPHHITQRGVRSMDVFHSEDDRCQYLQFLYEETARFGVDILAWCLMATRTGRPAGSDDFVQRIEQVAARDLSIGMPGRPRKQGL